MEVRKSDGSLQELNTDKIKKCVTEAFNSIGEVCPEYVLDSLVGNLYLYDRILTSEIDRQVLEALMSINKLF